jgi:peptide/nickel transport system ATP-binding protein
VVMDAQHPYTHGLMGAIPKVRHDVERLTQIEGSMPRLTEIPLGCPFNPRCPEAGSRCHSERPILGAVGSSQVACWRYDSAGTDLETGSA